MVIINTVILLDSYCGTITQRGLLVLQSVVTFSNFAKPWLLFYLLRYLNRPTIFYAINSRANSQGQNSGKKKCISVKQHL